MAVIPTRAPRRVFIPIALALVALALPALATAGKSLQTPTKSFDFGAVALNNPVSQTFSFTNAGKGPITLSEAIVGTVAKGYTDFGFGLSSSCQGTTLSPGDSCDTEIYFTPSMYGRRSGTLVVTASDGSSAKIGLSGTGV